MLFCVLTGRVRFALMDFLTATQRDKVNKGPGGGVGMLCVVMPRAVMVQPKSHGLELGEKMGYVNDEALGCAEG